MAMSNGSQYPLSGDVTQAINPFSWWIRSGQQAGFVNINLSRTGDPDLERRIVEEVASYGRQLGRIVEALDVVVARLPADGYTADERDALRAFSELAGRIAAVKEQDRPARLTLAGLDRLLADVQALRRRDRALYKEMVARIRAAFPPQ
jgi:hypothetical protein